jgi:hypothetical protein
MNKPGVWTFFIIGLMLYASGGPLEYMHLFLSCEYPLRAGALR